MADVVSSTESTVASFIGLFLSIPPAASKYMATIFNTSSTRKVVIQRITVMRDGIAAVTGVLLSQSLVFITAESHTTTFILDPEDTKDAISPGIVISTGNTAVTAIRTIIPFVVSSEEPTTAFTNLQLGSHGIGRVIYERMPNSRGLTLRQNEGVAIQNITSSTVGAFHYLFEITDEPA